MKTEDEYLEMVRKDGLALRNMPHKEWTAALCEAAVRQNSDNLRYVPAALQPAIQHMLEDGYE
jgi:hypothetical protein